MGIPIFAETLIPANKRLVGLPEESWLNYNLDTWLKDDATYLVRFDGEEYLLKPVRQHNTDRIFCVGNPTVYSAQEGDVDNGLQFVIRSPGNSMDTLAVVVVRADYDRTIYCELVTEDAEPLSFGKFIASPKQPFLPKNIWGWKMAQKRGDS